jgi:hypothetical protein
MTMFASASAMIAGSSPGSGARASPAGAARSAATSAVVVMLVAAFALVGCANEHAIFRTPKLDGEESSLVTDAKQRVIVNTKAENNFYHGWNKPTRIVCVEPSPDVAQAISSAITASLDATKSSAGSSQQTSGALGVSLAESVVQLGERLAVIQLLRDEMADLCRAYSNGAVSATTYTLRLAQLDRKMVTLLQAEMSAGAFGRRLAGAGGTAGTSAEPTASKEEIDAAKEKERTAEVNVASKRKELEDAKAKNSNSDPKDDVDTKPLEAALKTEEDKLIAARLELAVLLVRSRSSFAQAIPESDIGTISGRPTTDFGEVAAQITAQQRQYLDDDDVGVLLAACVSSMDLMQYKLDANTKADIKKLQEKYLEATYEIKRLESETQIAPSTNGEGQTKITAQEKIQADTKNEILAIYLANLDASSLSPFGTYCLLGGGIEAVQRMVEEGQQSRAERRRISEVERLEAASSRRIAALCIAVMASKDETLKEARAYCEKEFKDFKDVL